MDFWVDTKVCPNGGQTSVAAARTQVQSSGCVVVGVALLYVVQSRKLQRHRAHEKGLCTKTAV